MKYPLIAFTAAFTCGIFFSTIYPLPFFVLLIALLILLAVSWYLAGTGKEWFPYILLIAAFVLGTLRMQHADETKVTPLFENNFIRGMKLYGTINTCELPARGGMIFSVTADSIRKGDSLYVSKKLLLVNLYEDSIAQVPAHLKLRPGNKIIVNGNYYRFKEKSNPYQWKEEAYYSGLGYAGKFRITHPDSMIIMDSTESFYETMVLTIRQGIDARLDSLFNDEAYGLMRGLLLADRRGMNREVVGQFSDAGVIHILAVSGLHIGFIAFMIGLLLSRLRGNAKVMVIVITLWLYLILIGFPTSAVRAVLMISLYLIGRMMQRDPNPIHSVFAAGFIILMFEPTELFAIGFQLSFSAVSGILYFYPLFEKRLQLHNIKNILLRYISSLFFVSAAAQIGVMTVLLYHFGTVPLLSVFANIPVIPLSALILAGGLLSLLASYIWMGAGVLFAEFTQFLSSVLYAMVDYFAGYKYISLQAEHFSLFGIILFVSVIIASLFVLRSDKFRNTIAFSILVVLFSTLPLYKPLYEKTIFPPGMVSVLFLDAGQGDAVLIISPSGKTLLIDGGLVNPYVNTAEQRIIPLLKRINRNQIDAAILSHYDADHYGGVAGLMHTGYISAAVMPERENEILVDDDLWKLAELNHVKIFPASDTLFTFDGMQITIMKAGWANETEKFHSNNSGISLKLQYGNNSFLFTGDLYSAAEKSLVEKYGAYLKADVFKAGHHGSKTSNSELLLKTVSPSHTVISCALGNRYNHPAQEALFRFKEHNITIHRTDLQGAVLFHADGKTVKKVNW